MELLEIGSNLAIFKLLISGLFLFFIFRIVNFVIPFFKLKQELNENTRKYLPMIELIFWSLFLIGGIIYLLKSDNPLLAIGIFILLLIILLIVSWYSLRDIIAGIIFKYSNNVILNDKIIIGENSGIIKKLTIRIIEIENKSGEIIQIPYSHVLDNIIKKSHPAELIRSHHFRIQISKEDKLLSTIEEIKREVLNLPWISIKREPEVRPIDENDESFLLDVTIYSIKQEYFYEIEKHVKDVFDINHKN